METTAGQPGIDLTRESAHPGLALILALLSIPGSTLAFDVFSGAGYVIGIPPAVAAIALATRARRHSESGRGMAAAAIAIAGLMLAQMAVWTLVSAIT